MKSKNNKSQIIAIVGPTATGKSDLAVRLAKEFNGEIISADSRQVYTGLDIGTGKITEKEMEGVPHHMLDVENPAKNYSAGRFKDEARKIMDKIISRNKIPIVVGGTGFYIDSLIEGVEFPNAPVNLKLRNELSDKNAPELFEKLLKLDPERASSIDKHNKVRLVRAIEVAESLGKNPPLKRNSKYDCLWIGLDLPKEKLNKKIEERLIRRLKSGMIEEVKNLHQKGLSYERMDELGLEYRQLAKYLQKKIVKKEMVEELLSQIRKYAKRQRTWFKRNKNIKWFEPEEYQKIHKLAENFLKSKSTN